MVLYSVDQKLKMSEMLMAIFLVYSPSGKKVCHELKMAVPGPQDAQRRVAIIVTTWTLDGKISGNISKVIIWGPLFALEKYGI